MLGFLEEALIANNSPIVQVFRNSPALSKRCLKAAAKFKEDPAEIQQAIRSYLSARILKA
jgi:hypothetical protein